VSKQVKERGGGGGGGCGAGGGSGRGWCRGERCAGGGGGLVTVGGGVGVCGLGTVGRLALAAGKKNITPRKTNGVRGEAEDFQI